MMKGTDYPTFGRNYSTPRYNTQYPRPRTEDDYLSGASTRKVKTPVPKNKQEAAKKVVQYFLTEKELRLGNAVRRGKIDVSTPGVFLYLGSIRDPKKGNSEENMLTGRIIEVVKVDGSYFDINKDSDLVLKKYKENNIFFDNYLGLPFVKGMTDPTTGRTMFMVGDYTHHGQAAQGYFMVGEAPYNLSDELGFGDVVLWNNIGDISKEGFLGIDFLYKSSKNLGGAKTIEDVVKVLNILKDQGFSGKRKVILLRTPHLNESSLGSFLRSKKRVKTIDDYLGFDPEELESQKGLVEHLLKQESMQDEETRLNFGK